MLKNAKDNMLRLYVKAANRLSASAMSRDTRGQAFSDYLIVIALVVVMVLAVAGPAKFGVNTFVVTLFAKLQTAVASLNL